MEKQQILGLNFDAVTLEQAADIMFERLAADKATMVVTANAEFGKNAIENAEIRNLYNGADLLVADGAGVVLASKILAKPIKQKVAGIELADECAARAAKSGAPLFLLGSKPGVAERAGAFLQKKYPALHICGVCDGYFKDDEPVLDSIVKSRAGLVFVCLGSPKQERFMVRLRQRHSCAMIGLGGTIDIFAGEQKRAPEIFIKLNLEWFYRLIKEPSRIGRMMKLPAYVFAAVLQRFKIKNYEVTK